MMRTLFVLALALVSSSAFGPPLRHAGLTTTQSLFMISSGFSFGDGEQVLVSVQKPLGIVLEEQEDDSSTIAVVVVDMLADSSAGRAGVQLGDVLVAVQNADMTHQPIETVLGIIGQAPTVINLRFRRPSST